MPTSTKTREFKGMYRVLCPQDRQWRDGDLAWDLYALGVVIFQSVIDLRLVRCITNDSDLRLQVLAYIAYPDTP